MPVCVGYTDEISRSTDKHQALQCVAAVSHDPRTVGINVIVRICDINQVSHYRGSIVADHLQKSRRQVLVRLESILGNACYNANIQNYGPGGIREAEGRSFRYPLTLRLSDGSKQKVSSGTIPDSVSDDALRSGYYAFGANQLDVISALDRMLKYLEQHHDLVIANGG